MTERSLTIDPNTSRTEAGNEELRIDPDSQSWRSVPRQSPRYTPLFIPHGQTYYWTREWQEGIGRSMADLEAGNYTDFDSDTPDALTRRFAGGEE